MSIFPSAGFAAQYAPCRVRIVTTPGGEGEGGEKEEGDSRFDDRCAPQMHTHLKVYDYLFTASVLICLLPLFLSVYCLCSACFLRKDRFITALPQGPDSIELVEYS